MRTNCVVFRRRLLVQRLQVASRWTANICENAANTEGVAVLKLLGRGGRTFRSLWMLEEAGIAYERELVDFASGDTRSAAFLAINPNGKVPVLLDGDLVLFESLAINCHIARRYADAMWPSNAIDQSRTIAWLAWALGELEGPHDAANRTGTTIDASALDTSLEALRRALAGAPYLLGEHFTVADLNTASVLLRPQYRSVVRADDVLQDWFERCAGRPALKRALAKNSGDG